MGEDYFRQYGLIAVFLLIAVSVPIGMLMLSRVGTIVCMRPTRPTPTEPEPEPSDRTINPEEVKRRSQMVKLATYESGMRAVGSRWTRFNFRYYYFALLFVVFDVETIFLYPWAVRYGVLSETFGWVVLAEVVVFLAVVTLGYVYAWRKKALEWV
ncbi:MAG: NADH-quinone oxidoreductase subunit A [Dehalococcoidia bacterium]|nr:NADH-quinone oxidoreductase subunit A [Dehalococcoidia bacterium]